MMSACPRLDILCDAGSRKLLHQVPTLKICDIYTNTLNTFLYDIPFQWGGYSPIIIIYWSWYMWWLNVIYIYMYHLIMATRRFGQSHLSKHSPLLYYSIVMQPFREYTKQFGILEGTDTLNHTWSFWVPLSCLSSQK